MNLPFNPADLPTLAELEARGPAVPGRALTEQERRQKQADRAARPPHLQTKKRSEALCKRQFERWGASLKKARDDERFIKGVGLIRVSIDVDFVGSIPLRLGGQVTATPLKVESKGVTLRESRTRYHEDGSKTYQLNGSFPLRNLSGKERGYLNKHRRDGGLSVVHIAWWFEGKCQAVHVIPWRDWLSVDAALTAKAADDKRFQGKSLRYHADRDLLDRYLVQKVRGRWALTESHWLVPLLANGQQPELL